LIKLIFLASIVQGNLKVANDLLAKSITHIDINSVNSPNQMFWLHVASVKNKIEMVRLLLDYGATPNIMDKDGRTPLYRAAEKGYTEIVKLLVSKGAIIDTADKDGKTPLYVACQNCDTELIKFLLSEGADINVADKDGKVAVVVAAEKDCIDAVELLLDYDARVLTTAYARTLLDRAIQKKNVALLELLFYHAAARGVLEPGKFLVDGSISVADSNGDTLLHIAAQKGHMPVVVFLLKHGAKINALNKQGKTPRDIAIDYKQQEIVYLLSNNSRNIVFGCTLLIVGIILVGGRKMLPMIISGRVKQDHVA
jgi:ankyrin repeat protein